MREDLPPTDADLYPTLTEDGARMLERLREHPHAPIFRNRSGNRLTAAEVQAAREFERVTITAPFDSPHDWLPPFIERCLEQVPFYRKYGPPPLRLADLPTISRDDLSRDVAQFVPDDMPTERLIFFHTSGSTGHPLLVPSHPTVAARYFGFHKRALTRFGIELKASRGQLGIVLLGWQRKCFTYVSVTPTMDEAGLAKINLHPGDWQHPNDRAAYLNDLNPEVFSGDPISYTALLDLNLSCRPRALLSTAMALSTGMRERLQTRFGCPVVDIYSMNEAGPVAYYDPQADGHVLLQPRMFVEIVDSTGQPVPLGARGEVTLTGGFNDWLPLLRYRTGDQAALRKSGSAWVLDRLEGRPPVRYRTQAGEWINNLEITHALLSIALPQFTLHQDEQGSLQLIYCGAASNASAIRVALEGLFGSNQPMVITHTGLFDGKVLQYTSRLDQAVL